MKTKHDVHVFKCKVIRSDVSRDGACGRRGSLICHKIIASLVSVLRVSCADSQTYVEFVSFAEYVMSLPYTFITVILPPQSRVPPPRHLPHLLITRDTFIILPF